MIKIKKEKEYNLIDTNWKMTNETLKNNNCRQNINK